MENENEQEITFIIDTDKIQHIQALLGDLLNSGIDVKLEQMEHFQICVNLKQ